jgi:hypothetical protein
MRCILPVKHLLVKEISGNIFTGNLFRMFKQEKSREMMFSKISEWEKSGLNQKAFCQHNIVSSSFHYSYKRFRDACLSADRLTHPFVVDLFLCNFTIRGIVFLHP